MTAGRKKRRLAAHFQGYILVILMIAGSFFAERVYGDQITDTIDVSAQELTDEESLNGYTEAPWNENPVPTAEYGLSYSEALKNMVDGSSGVEEISAGEELPVKVSDSGSETPKPTADDDGSRYPNYETEDEILTYLTMRFPQTRDQTVNGVHYGCCWAQAATALAEFYMISHGLGDRNGPVTRDTDYSELQLAYFSYNQGPDPLQGGSDDCVFLDESRGTKRHFLNFGGNLSFAAQTLMRGIGYAEDAGRLAYANAAKVLIDGLPDEFARMHNVLRLKNQFMLNMRADTTLVKQAIRENGAVGISYCSKKEYINKSTHAYYNPVDSNFNHVVVIVGWNDHYPASNFKKTPPGDGAWLVRNSHSTKTRFSEESYFWISYYDKSIGKTAYVYEMADPAKGEDHANTYFYDTQLHDVKNAPATKVANIFTTVGEAEELRAVQFDATDFAPGKYKVTVFRDLTDVSNPESGGAVQESVTTGRIAFSGKYTIPLNAAVRLSRGETFAIILETENPIDREADCLWKKQLDMDTVIREGESFAFMENAWKDLAGWSYEGTRGNLCIRALTDPLNDVSLPDRVENLVVRRNTLKEVQISWAAARDAEGYEVWRRTDKEFERIGGTTSDKREFADSEAIPGKMYIYKVYPVRGGGGDELGASPEISVLRARPAPKEISMAKKQVTLQRGKTKPLKIRILPVGSDDTISWISSQPEVAWVDRDGLLTAAGVGEASVLAVAPNGLRVSCEVRVLPPEVQKLTLNRIRTEVMVGRKLQLSAKMSPRDARKTSLIWKSSDKKIAAVSRKGVVTGIKSGECTITAVSKNGLRATCKVTVAIPHALRVRLSKNHLKLHTGLSKRLSATVMPADAVDGAVSWKSSNPEVATVSAKGLVTAIRCGSCTVTATSEKGIQDICRIEVKQIVVYACEKQDIFRLETDEKIVGNLKNEGWICRKAFRAAGKSDVPIYQIFDPKTKLYRYTAEKSVAKAARAEGCQAKRAFYGTDYRNLPVYALSKNTRWRYTVNRSEAKKLKNQGWLYQGIAWYAEQAGI